MPFLRTSLIVTINSDTDQQTTGTRNCTRKNNLEYDFKIYRLFLRHVKLLTIKIRGHLGSIVGDSVTSGLETRGTSRMNLYLDRQIDFNQSPGLPRQSPVRTITKEQEAWL
jgi:hypothetical protein